MKKSILFVFALLLSLSIKAQVKIGATWGTPSNSSVLEIESNNRGFLPPRIFLNSQTMPLNGGLPGDGTVVFNTNFGTNLGGLCIWHHNQWNKLVDSRKIGKPTRFIKLTQNVSQVMPTGNSIVNWDARSIESVLSPGDSPMWNGGSDIIIQKSGMYCIVVNVALAVTDGNQIGSPGERYISISVNGIQAAGSGSFLGVNSFMNLSAMVYCNQFDRIRIGVLNGRDVAVKTITSPNKTVCFVAEIPTVKAE
ncbi:MAG: hypothetical protein EOO85_13220 [Pedobacter sp.]|nr:MAG: hypothetical protein EOO85_13220 [Pedobacter sp.]